MQCGVGDESLFDELVLKLTKMAPPIEAFGIGGSTGAGRRDDVADLDFFILVPTSAYEAFLGSFVERMGSHTKPLVTSWERGVTPLFGYQFSFIYDDFSCADFFINCPVTLRQTPMAKKTRVLLDSAGYFTSFHEALTQRSDPAAELRHRAMAELLSETMRIRKYATRGELVSIVHRLERIRLLGLALQRFLHHGQDFVPHDADKWVLRDLGIQTVERLTPTFPRLSGPEIAGACSTLTDYVAALLATLDPDVYTSDAWNLIGRAVHETTALLHGGGVRGPSCRSATARDAT